jgi:hypothetical protein
MAEVDPIQIAKNHLKRNTDEKLYRIIRSTPDEPYKWGVCGDNDCIVSTQYKLAFGDWPEDEEDGSIKKGDLILQLSDDEDNSAPIVNCGDQPSFEDEEILQCVKTQLGLSGGKRKSRRTRKGKSKNKKRKTNRRRH